MDDLSPKSLDALETWLRGELDEHARLNQLHTSTCNLVLGSISGNLNDECDCDGPKFVLDDVDAKREILNGPLTGSGPDQHTEWEWTIRLLAAPFANRPGYRKEWRP
jgi:hypothetical protein